MNSALSRIRKENLKFIANLNALEHSLTARKGWKSFKHCPRGEKYRNTISYLCHHLNLECPAKTLQVNSSSSS